MKKAVIALCVVSIPFLFTGCDSSSKKSTKKKSSDVGVGDVADYATGVTPLKTKQKSEKMLNDIVEKNKVLKEQALKDK